MTLGREGFPSIGRYFFPLQVGAEAVGACSCLATAVLAAVATVLEVLSKQTPNPSTHPGTLGVVKTSQTIITVISH